jgi:hypothetical protein
MLGGVSDEHLHKPFSIEIGAQHVLCEY